jgi:hypothetical protein
MELAQNGLVKKNNGSRQAKGDPGVQRVDATAPKTAPSGQRADFGRTRRILAFAEPMPEGQDGFARNRRYYDALQVYARGASDEPTS